MVAPDEHRGRIYELAHQEAVRALVEQQAAIDNLRTRAGVLISAAAVATSFLGGQALKTGLRFGSVIGLTAFAALGLTSLTVLWPRDEAGSAAIPSRIIELYAERDGPVPIGMVHREMAYHMEGIRDGNEQLRQLLMQRFRTASACLGLEVLGWVVDLLATS
jgi:hypothetical protein